MLREQRRKLADPGPVAESLNTRIFGLQPLPTSRLVFIEENESLLSRHCGFGSLIFVAVLASVHFCITACIQLAPLPDL